MAKYGLQTEVTEHIAGMGFGDAADGGGGEVDNSGMPWGRYIQLYGRDLTIYQATIDGVQHLYCEYYMGDFPEEPYYGYLSAMAITNGTAAKQIYPDYIYLHFHDEIPSDAQVWAHANLGNMGAYIFEMTPPE